MKHDTKHGKHDTNHGATHDDRRERPDAVRLGTTDTLRTASTDGLAHLGDLDDYKVADGEPDIRGWDVKAADGRKLGEVDDLLVDTGTLQVRYVEVKLAEDVAKEAARAGGGAADRSGPVRHVLVPIGVARLDDEHDDVCLDARAVRLAGLPSYARGDLTRAYEAGLLKGYGRDDRPRDDDARAFYSGREFDDQAFFGKRRQKGDGATYITRSEEQLAVGTRPVERGSVDVRKRVETERVHESVPVSHERVTVQRHAVAGDAARGGDVQIGEREIRIPVMGEELVTEKRVVPKEEIVIRKEAVTENRTVEADLRRERVDVDKHVDDGGRTR